MPSEIQTAFLLKGFPSTALHKGGFFMPSESLSDDIGLHGRSPPAFKQERMSRMPDF
ncbi:TPA: hypothetical protein WHZ31_001934 [Neisseria meningitidis]